MDVVIVGSGPSAAATALALTQNPDVNVTVLDIGGTLDSERQAAISRLSSQEPENWNAPDVRLISAIPTSEVPGQIPTKQIYASNFPFEDFGQLHDVTSDGLVNPLISSGAYGGFSNTWGAQVMAFTSSTLAAWPFDRSVLEPHYRSILAHIPYSANVDDLEEFFPLFGESDSLPTLADRTQSVLRRYSEHRLALRRRGITVGAARLALKGSACRRCGLCMTGCPYSLIYSASHTFDELRRRSSVTYIAGQRVVRVSETSLGRPQLTVQEIQSGSIRTVECDRLFLAAGSVATTRIVANSLDLHDVEIPMQESAQFLTAFASLRPTRPVTQDGEFTLNQFNIFMTDGHDDRALVHCYPYNDIMLGALPSVLSTPLLSQVSRRGLRHITVGLGYLPSPESPSLILKIGSATDAASLPATTLTWKDNAHSVDALRDVTRRLTRAGRALDLFPVPGQTKFSNPGKSYHFGGSFPHSASSDRRFESDLLGRVQPWRHIHLVDASVFPTVAATTFTLTIMANAHRIATQVLNERAE